MTFDEFKKIVGQYCNENPGSAVVLAQYGRGVESFANDVPVFYLINELLVKLFKYAGKHQGYMPIDKVFRRIVSNSAAMVKGFGLSRKGIVSVLEDAKARALTDRWSPADIRELLHLDEE